MDTHNMEWTILDVANVMDTGSDQDDYEPDMDNALCVTIDCANMDCSQQIYICGEAQYQEYCLYHGCCSIACHDWLHSQDIDLLCAEMMQIKC